MRTIFILIGFVVLSLQNASAQLHQTIRGTVIELESQFPLIGVNASVKLEDGTVLGTSTDIDGSYRIEKVPIGRQAIYFSYLGYKDVNLTDIIVGSGKEVILNIEMEESVLELESVEVIARRAGEINNEMATVSARQFSVQETDRYAGSRGDPGRMASNFAGVQGADDSRNDIVIRGNSPQGVLWKLEGLNIPNPNHFSIPGTGGGSVTILNNKYLANSDFFTGAFPAEYGNGVAGAFDLKMRNGNNEKHEFSGQVGFLGTELMAEGPLSKNGKASYLVNYRYSTLQLFNFLGINIGTDAVPKYQDAAFRLNFPAKNGSNLAIFGIGGNSSIDIKISDEEAPIEGTLIFGSNDRDQLFATRMGMIGMSYTYPINQSTFFKASIGASQSRVDSDHNFIFRRVVDNQYIVDSLPPLLDYRFQENKYSANLHINKKLGKRGSLKAGINVDLYDVVYRDSARAPIVVDSFPDLVLGPWRTRWDASDQIPLVQPYIQYKYKFSDQLKLTAGITSLYFGINDKSFSPIEPRLGLSYQINDKSKISFGTGLHSQIQPTYLYYYGEETINGDPVEQNLDKIGLLKSAHFVLGYDRRLGDNLKLKFETYYQRLFDLPISAEVNSFSLINSGSGFTRLFPGELATGGAGENYGLEMTLEKYFSNGYYYLLTGSLFNSKYKGSDDIWRNTSFNGQYAVNALFAKEWNVKENQTINIGGKITYNGGRWYGEVDEARSAQELEVIYEQETTNTLQFRPYFRADAKVNYRINTKRLTHEIAIDLVNVFNIKNILTLTYAPDHPDGPVVEEYQLGFLPLFYYKVEF